jgi:hypothetical protein
VGVVLRIFESLFILSSAKKCNHIMRIMWCNAGNG